MTLHFVTIIAIIRAREARGRVLTRESHKGPACLSCNQPWTHHDAHAHVTSVTRAGGRRCAAIAREIERRFFPRSLLLLCFDSGGELWFRATTSARLLPSRLSSESWKKARERARERERERERDLIGVCPANPRAAHHLPWLLRFLFPARRRSYLIGPDIELRIRPAQANTIAGYFEKGSFQRHDLSRRSTRDFRCCR